MIDPKDELELEFSRWLDNCVRTARERGLSWWSITHQLIQKVTTTHLRQPIVDENLIPTITGIQTVKHL